MSNRIPPSKGPSRNPPPGDGEDIVMLMGLAALAEQRGLSSRVFPNAIEQFQKDTGHELSFTARQMAAMIKHMHNRGNRYTPEQVAKLLRGRAAKIMRGEDLGKIDWGES
jgi:dihydroxyacetone kinase